MLIAPSILTSNFLELKKELASISNSDLIHVDIMDGHFVPNISFGPYISKLIASSTKLKLDFHLMVSEPAKWVDLFNFKNTIARQYASCEVYLSGYVKKLLPGKMPARTDPHYTSGYRPECGNTDP